MLKKHFVWGTPLLALGLTVVPDGNLARAQSAPLVLPPNFWQIVEQDVAMILAAQKAPASVVQVPLQAAPITATPLQAAQAQAAAAAPQSPLTQITSLLTGFSNLFKATGLVGSPAKPTSTATPAAPATAPSSNPSQASSSVPSQASSGSSASSSVPAQSSDPSQASSSDSSQASSSDPSQASSSDPSQTSSSDPSQVDPSNPSAVSDPGWDSTSDPSIVDTLPSTSSCAGCGGGTMDFGSPACGGCGAGCGVWT